MVDSVKLLNANTAYNVTKSQKMPGGGGIIPFSEGNPKVKESSFATLVGESVEKAAATVKTGETVAMKALVDQASLTDLATAVTDAELSLRTVVAVRDRIISAYQEIIKMPI